MISRFLQRKWRAVRRGTLLLASGGLLATSAGAALLDPALSFPLISFNSMGSTTYDAATDRFVVDASPLIIFEIPGDPPAFVSGNKSFRIEIEVDDTGALVGGVPGDDLVVTGDVTLSSGPVSGVLLTGEVTAFGFSDTGGPTDLYDFTFTVTGGALAGDYPATVGINLTSEDSDFVGTFTHSFGGGAKGTLGGLNTALGDFVWEDCNGNGIQDDASIPGCLLGGGIPNVPVVLTAAGPDGLCNTTDDVPAGSTTTDADGEYLFPDLQPDVDYCVTFPEPETLASALDCAPEDVAYTTKGLDADSGVDSNANPNGTTDPVSLDLGETNLTIDAGLYCLASLGDTLWEDFDRDGIQDGLNQPGGEPGIDGVTVTLFDCDNNEVGSPTTTGPAPADAVPPQSPGGAGWYQFDRLVPGCYRVRFDKPGADYVFSAAGQGADPALDSDVDAAGNTGQINLVSGESNPTIDAGVNLPPAGLGDFVFTDQNANGIQDPGDEGIPGVPVYLLTPGSDGICNSADDVRIDGPITTDANGYYEFTGLYPGDYCVEFDKSAVFCEFGLAQFSPQNQGGDPARDSDPEPDTGVTGNISLEALDFDPDNDAGIYCPAALGDRVWYDLNGNGVQDCSDALADGGNGSGIIGDVVGGVPDVGEECDQAAVADVMVELSTRIGGQCAPGTLLETATDENGFYEFEPLTPGVDYCVRWIRPADTECTTPNVGSDPAIDSDGIQANGACQTDEPIVLASGDFDPNWDLGLIQTPPECNLLLDKSCRVETPPLPVFTEKCDGAIQEFTMVWGGDKAVTIQEVEKLSSVVPALGSVITPGDVVVFVPDGGDPVVEVFDLDGKSLGESTWHMSCSDKDMDADTATNDGQLQVSDLGQDCGKWQGNAKENDPDQQEGLVNDWRLAGLVDDKDKQLICTEPEPGPFADSCAFDAQLVSCDTVGKPDVFTFRYLGIGPVSECTDNAATLADDKPPSCSGNLPVGATVEISANADVSKTTVGPGETFELSGFGSQTEITLSGGGGEEFDSFHTSCSAPLEVGDVFGNLELVAFDGQKSSATVTYRYEVTNLGDPLTLIQVTDDRLGDIGVIPELPVNGSNIASLEAVAEISETTTNTATAVGVLANGDNCAATSNSVVVTRNEPLVPVSCDDIKELTTLSMVWDGPSGVNVTTQLGQVFDNVQKGNQITFTVNRDAGNDFVITLSGAVSGHSTFHLSCSDSEMDGSDDCGKYQGDGKSDDDGLNLWRLDGMMGENGSFSCGLDNTGVVAPEPGGGPVGGVSGATVADLSDAKKFKWALTNTTSQDVFVTDITVKWPDGNGQLKKIKLEGDFVKDLFADGPEVMLTTADFDPDPNKAKLKAGDTNNLEIEFTEETLYRDQTDFEVVVTFDNGDVVTFTPAPLSVTGASTLDLGDDKKVKWALTNNTTGDLLITAVTVTWPAAHGALKKMKLAGDFFKDSPDSDSPTVVDESDFTDNEGDRKLNDGDTKNLEIEFTDDVADRIGDEFTIAVMFSNGKMVNYTYTP